MPSEVIQEAEEEEINDDEKAMKETVLIRLNMSNAIFDKTNLMFSVLVLFSLNIL